MFERVEESRKRKISEDRKNVVCTTRRERYVYGGCVGGFVASPTRRRSLIAVNTSPLYRQSCTFSIARTDWYGKIECTNKNEFALIFLTESSCGCRGRRGWKFVRILSMWAFFPVPRPPPLLPMRALSRVASSSLGLIAQRIINESKCLSIRIICLLIFTVLLFSNLARFLEHLQRDIFTNVGAETNFFAPVEAVRTNQKFWNTSRNATMIRQISTHKMLSSTRRSKKPYTKSFVYDFRVSI